MKYSILKWALLSGLFLSFIQFSFAETHANKRNIKGFDVICCDVSKIKDTIDLKLSDFMDQCEMVKLETTAHSVLGRIHYVSVSDNYIAVFTYDRPHIPVKLFHRDGKFVCDVGLIGKGPGEYTSLYGIQIDEPANRIYLTPFANAQQILVYDLKGNPMPEIRLVYKQTKCRVFIEDGIVTVLSMPFNDQIPVAYQQTTSGKLIKELPRMKHLIQRPDFSHEISSDHNTNAYDLFILPWGADQPDTLYHYNIKKNILEPKFVISDGDAKVGSWYREYKKFYFSYLWGEKYNGKKILVDKESLKADYFNLVNDFYGGIGLNEFFMSQHGMFTASMSADELMNKLDKVLQSKNLSSDQKVKITAARKTLDINDNPILFIGEMKD